MLHIVIGSLAALHAGGIVLAFGAGVLIAALGRGSDRTPPPRRHRHRGRP